MSKRIMVTGSSGFIGSHVSHDLLKRGNTVIGVDDLSGGFYENVSPLLAQYPHQFLFYKQDVGNYAAMNEIMLAHRPETVVHCAAVAQEGASFFQPVAITYTNAMISATLLELAIKHQMSRFIFFSSMAVYGAANKPPFDERMKRQPVDLYGCAKSFVEAMVEQLSVVHGFSYVIIRPHNVIGPRQSMVDPYRNVAAITMQRILRKEKIYIYGEGHRRAFSGISDSLPCFIRAILNDSLNRETINVGGKEDITIDTLVKAIIEDMLGQGAEYPIVHTPPRHGEVPNAFCTVKRSEELLGYEEHVGWREEIRRMSEWAKEQGQRPWRFSPLPLITEAAPLPWKELNNFTDKS